jgi:cytochrome c553/uncharacterized protein (DUF302 family)
MKKILLLTFLFSLAPGVYAANMANGEKINKSCALCHGAFGQGAPGELSPRIAGMPKEYLIKAIEEYRDGKVRKYGLMVYTSHLDKLTDSDIEDVATYLASMDLSSDARFNIQKIAGDEEKGEEIYKDECRNCHNRDGYGKPSKEAPPLAGQHATYLYTTMKNFVSKLRIHDNDPDDDSFEDYKDQELIDITAYLASLDDKKIVAGYEFTPPVIRVASAPTTTGYDAALEITDITQTVVKMALEDGVDREDAITAMNDKAINLDLKLVGQQYVSKALAKQGVEGPYLSIHQYCNPLDARLMIMANPIFSSYMPCRISMVEDSNGKTWLMMLNLDMLINSKLLPPAVIETAVKVNQQMLDIMVAGAKGES